jgi:predicted PurR-regulated permease PerM
VTEPAAARPSSPPSPLPEAGAGLGLRWLATGAAFVIVVAGLRLAGEWLVPFLLAGFLAILTAPPLLWLERRRVPVGLAVAVTMTAVLLILLALGGVLAASIQQFSLALPRYKAGLVALTGEGLALATTFGLRVDLERGLGPLLAQVSPGALIETFGTMLNGLLAAATQTAMVLLAMLFMLLEAAGLPRKLRAALEQPEADLSRFARILVEVQNYLAVKTWVSALTGGLIYVLTLAVGVDFAALWGLIGFLLNYIPTIGSIVAAVPAVLVALVQYGFTSAAVVLAGYIVINQVVGNVLEPQLMGRTMGLSALVVFASLVFWGWLWGPVGMLLSVPLTMVVKILLEQSDDLRFIAVLLGPAPPPAGRGALAGPHESIVARMQRMPPGGRASASDGAGDPQRPGA